MNGIVGALLKQFGPVTGSSAPAVPALSLADKADGTGATATIAGATAGTANTIYTAAWSGGLAAAAFASAGSRVGNGTVSLALQPGYYWAYCVSTSSDSAISLVKGLRVTSGDAAVFYQVLDAVLAKLQTLTLAGIDPSSIYKRKFAWNRNAATPGLFVTPASDRFTPSLNTADDIGYGVQLTWVQASNQDLESNLAAQLLWREQIAKAFLPASGSEPLAGVTEVFDVRIEPGPVIDPGAFMAHYDVGALVLRFIARETRRMI